jgi:hypothetical protein
MLSTIAAQAVVLDILAANAIANEGGNNEKGH